MAKNVQISSEVRIKDMKSQIRAKNLKMVYVLMGEEPYYSDIIENELLEHVLTPEEKDFNLTIMYASDTNPQAVVEAARRYPVFAQRQLVIVREAQGFRNLDLLDSYIANPAPETVLVLRFTGKSPDKRSSFYKNLSKSSNVEVFESVAVKPEKMWSWVIDYLREKGISITDRDAVLMAEYAGNNLRRMQLELDKLIQSLPSNIKNITSQDIEKNIGISREFSVFELCSAICNKDKEKAYRIAHHLGANPKQYPLQMTLGGLFYYFSKILGAYAYYKKDRISPLTSIANAGIPFFQRDDILSAMRNYSFGKAIGMITWLRECDYASKSNNGGQANEEELLMELLSRIFN